MTPPRTASSQPTVSRTATVIEYVTTLAGHFGAQVVAEGVDIAEVAETLRRYGVRFMQGYLFAEPLEMEEARAFARKVPG